MPGADLTRSRSATTRASPSTLSGPGVSDVSGVASGVRSGGAVDGGVGGGERDVVDGDGVAVEAARSPLSPAVAAGRLEVGMGDADGSAVGGTAQPLTMTMTSAAVAAAPIALIWRHRLIRERPPLRAPRK